MEDQVDFVVRVNTRSIQECHVRVRDAYGSHARIILTLSIKQRSTNERTSKCINLGPSQFEISLSKRVLIQIWIHNMKGRAYPELSVKVATEK